ncbi:MAG: hypothetical protein ACTSQD_07960, partial [Promethearchaeota archaeon]
MRIITFLLEAEEEMISSAQYYNQQSSGLGLDFLEEIEKSIQIIEKDPERWPYYEQKIHKYNTRRFRNQKNILLIILRNFSRSPFHEASFLSIRDGIELPQL